MHAGDYYDLLVEAGFDVADLEVLKDGPRVRLASSESKERAAEARALMLSARDRPKPMSYREAVGRALMGERTAEIRNTIARGVARMAKERERA